MTRQGCPRGARRGLPGKVSRDGAKTMKGFAMVAKDARRRNLRLHPETQPNTCGRAYTFELGECSAIRADNVKQVSSFDPTGLSDSE